MKPLLWHIHWPLAETANSHLQTVSQILKVQQSLANWEVYIPSCITQFVQFCHYALCCLVDTSC